MSPSFPQALLTDKTQDKGPFAKQLTRFVFGLIHRFKDLVCGCVLIRSDDVPLRETCHLSPRMIAVATCPVLEGRHQTYQSKLHQAQLCTSMCGRWYRAALMLAAVNPTSDSTILTPRETIQSIAARLDPICIPSRLCQSAVWILCSDDSLISCQSILLRRTRGRQQHSRSTK